MEPAYWVMRRLVQNVRPNSAESEFDALEVSPPAVDHPLPQSDPDAPIELAAGGTPLLAPEHPRVVTRGGWRVLLPPVTA